MELGPWVQVLGQVKGKGVGGSGVGGSGGLELEVAGYAWGGDGVKALGWSREWVDSVCG